MGRADTSGGAWDAPDAANRETGDIHEVATADPLPNGTHPTVPGYTIPELNDGRVY